MIDFKPSSVGGMEAASSLRVIFVFGLWMVFKFRSKGMEETGQHNSSTKDHGRDSAADTNTARVLSVENKLAAKAFEEIKLEVEKNNIMVKTNMTWILSFLELSWFLLAAWMFSKNMAAWSVGVIWGIAQFRAGLIMHMAIHRAIFKSDTMNIWFGVFVMNIISGISWRWWRRRHQAHHRETNILTADPDLKTYPMLVYNEQLPTSFITQFQTKLLPLYLVIYFPMWRISSVIKCIKQGWWYDISFTLLHWAFLLLIFTFSSYSFGQIYLILSLREAITGLTLGTIFMFGHFLEEVLPSSDHGLDPTLHVLKTTNNMESLNAYVNTFIVGFTGGLSLQIEHHLFPQCPVDKLSQLADITKTAVHRQGLDYHSTSFLGGLQDIWYRLEQIEDVALERHVVKTS